MKKLTLLVGAGIIGLAGCTTSQSVGYQRADATLKSYSRTIAGAVIIGEKCSRYTFNDDAANRMAEQLTEQLLDAGVSEREISSAVVAAKTPSRVLLAAAEYIRESGADLSEPASACRAGDREKSNNSAVGSLLRRG